MFLLLKTKIFIYFCSPLRVSKNSNKLNFIYNKDYNLYKNIHSNCFADITTSTPVFRLMSFLTTLKIHKLKTKMRWILFNS